MGERLMHSNTLISLTILLLMALALVASQVDAKAALAADGVSEIRAGKDLEAVSPPFQTTLRGHLNGKTLIISIDAMIRFGPLQLER